jgi:hypothetical protein
MFKKTVVHAKEQGSKLQNWTGSPSAQQKSLVKPAAVIFKVGVQRDEVMCNPHCRAAIPDTYTVSLWLAAVLL